MVAYEFKTTLHDGVIQIPAEYRNMIMGNVKIIIVQEDETIKLINNQESSFPFFAVDTTGYVFNRDEANER